MTYVLKGCSTQNETYCFYISMFKIQPNIVFYTFLGTSATTEVWEIMLDCILSGMCFKHAHLISLVSHCAVTVYKCFSSIPSGPFYLWVSVIIKRNICLKTGQKSESEITVRSCNHNLYCQYVEHLVIKSSLNKGLRQHCASSSVTWSVKTSLVHIQRKESQWRDGTEASSGVTTTSMCWTG